jgi:hypothetical protein
MTRHPTSNSIQPHTSELRSFASKFATVAAWATIGVVIRHLVTHLVGDDHQTSLHRPHRHQPAPHSHRPGSDRHSAREPVHQPTPHSGAHVTHAAHHGRLHTHAPDKHL